MACTTFAAVVESCRVEAMSTIPPALGSLTTEVMQIAYIIFSPLCGFIPSHISPSGLGGLPCTNHCGVI